MQRTALSSITLLSCVLATACAAGAVGSDDHGASAQWLCGAHGERVTCLAAIPATEGEAGAYACSGFERSETCPPADALVDVADQLPPEVLSELASLPWACLLTGAHQRHCIREALEMDPLRPPSEPSAPDADGPVGPAPIPRDCALSSWEAYFCQHSTHSYQSTGVDITFPCEVFDPDRSPGELAETLGGLASEIPRAASTDLSCHAGEWLMRDTSWLTAVLSGCLDLSDAILTMCQQAADYANETGLCVPTGTW